MGNTLTLHLAVPPLSNALSYEYDPMELLLTCPAMPASSKASSAANSCGDKPTLGHPLGMIQRRVPRDVTNMISSLEVRVAL
jgi:hypothetical protein